MSHKLVSAIPITLLGLAVLVTHVSPAHSQTYIQTNTTLDSSNPIAGYAVIGLNSNQSIKTSPTVNLVTGGSVGGGVIVANNSIFNMSGGSIGGDLTPQDNSTINISGGSIASFLNASGDNTINYSGGSVGQTSGLNIVLHYNDILNITGNNLALTNQGNFNSGYIYNLSGTLADGTNLKGYVVDTLNTFTGQVNLLAVPASTPEPGTYALLASLGLTGAAFLRRKKFRG